MMDRLKNIFKEYMLETDQPLFSLNPNSDEKEAKKLLIV